MSLFGSWAAKRVWFQNVILPTKTGWKSLHRGRRKKIPTFRARQTHMVSALVVELAAMRHAHSQWRSCSEARSLCSQKRHS